MTKYGTFLAYDKEDESGENHRPRNPKLGTEGLWAEYGELMKQALSAPARAGFWELMEQALSPHGLKDVGRFRED